MLKLEPFFNNANAKVTELNTAIAEQKQIHSLLFPKDCKNNNNTTTTTSKLISSQQRKSKFRRAKERLHLLQREMHLLEHINNLMMALSSEPLTVLNQPAQATAETPSEAPAPAPAPASNLPEATPSVTPAPSATPAPAPPTAATATATAPAAAPAQPEGALSTTELMAKTLQMGWKRTVYQQVLEYRALQRRVNVAFERALLGFTLHLASEGELFLMPNSLIPRDLEDCHKYFRYDDKTMGNHFFHHTKFGVNHYQFQPSEACWASFMVGEAKQTTEVPHYEAIQCLAKLPDGSILTGSKGSLITRWKLVEGPYSALATPATVSVFNEYSDPPSSGRISIRGDATRRFELYQTFEGHRGDINSIVVLSTEDDNNSSNKESGDEEDFRFISTSSDTTLKLWSTKTRKVIHTFEGHNDSVTCAALMNSKSPSQVITKLLLSGCEGGLIKVWSLDEPDYQCTRTIVVHSEITSLAPHDDTVIMNSFMSLSKDGMLRFWQLDVAEELTFRRICPESEDPSDKASHLIQLDNGLIVVACNQDLVFFSLMVVGELFRVRRAHEYSDIYGLVKMRDGMNFLSVGSSIKAWNSRAEPLFCCHNTHMIKSDLTSPPTAICEMNDGSVACGYESGLVLLWNTTPT